MNNVPICLFLGDEEICCYNGHLPKSDRAKRKPPTLAETTLKLQRSPSSVARGEVESGDDQRWNGAPSESGGSISAAASEDSTELGRAEGSDHRRTDGRTVDRCVGTSCEAVSHRSVSVANSDPDEPCVTEFRYIAPDSGTSVEGDVKKSSSSGSVASAQTTLDVQNLIGGQFAVSSL